MIDAIKSLVINEAYVDFFSILQLSLHYPSHVSNVVSCSSCFSESCLIVWKFSFYCALHSLRGHPFMTSTRRGGRRSGSGGRMWTGGGGQSPCGRPHRKLKLESTDVILFSSHAKKLAYF